MMTVTTSGANTDAAVSGSACILLTSWAKWLPLRFKPLSVLSLARPVARLRQAAA
jgi:hypothetical protein